MRSITLLILCFFLLLPCILAKNPNLNAALHFVENKGQITNEFGKSRSDVLYTLHTNGMSLYIGKDGLHYQFYKPVEACIEKTGKHAPHPQKFTTYRVDMKLKGINKDAIIIPGEQQAYFENYAGQLNVQAHAFDKITYKNVYPNIDWVLYLKDGKTEYDFIVHPGGKIENIRMKYSGAVKIFQTPEGNIKIESPMGCITERAPISYEKETGKEITSSFKLRNNTISFIAHKTNGTLVLDPTLVWGTYYGGGKGSSSSFTPGTASYAVRTDKFNNVFITGYTNSIDKIATSGGYSDTFISSLYSGYNAFIAKFDPNGRILWGTYYGSKRDEIGFDICLDRGNNIYIVGSTDSKKGLATPGVFASTGDAFLAKFDTSGNLKWATYFSDTTSGIDCKLTSDAASNIYVTGTTDSHTGIASPGSFMSSSTATASYGDGFIMKFDSSGHRIWGTYFGDSLADGINSITTDRQCNIYFTGNTENSKNIATPGSYQSTIAGGGAAFIEKFDSAGHRIWGTYLGKSSDGTGIVFDTLANCFYAVGYTNYNYNIATAGTFRDTVTGLTDDYLVKFDTAGHRVWGTFFGGDLYNYALAVDIDHNRHINFTGYTTSKIDLVTSDCFQDSNAGKDDVFLASFDTTGNLKWASFYGGIGWDDAYGISCDGLGASYITGVTGSYTGMATYNAHQSDLLGNWGAFLAKFGEDTTVRITEPFLDTLVCQGQSISIDYSTYNTFLPPNAFTVQLSDDSGNFAHPLNLKTFAGTTGGTVKAVIPAVTPSNKYYFRMISTYPVDTSAPNRYPIKVLSSVPPAVSIAVVFSTFTSGGVTDTTGIYTANAVNCDSALHFQWQLNGDSIPDSLGGRGNPIIIRGMKSHDIVSLLFKCATSCSPIDTVADTLLPLRVAPLVNNTSKILLYPNPNDGNFNFQAVINTTADNNSLIEISNAVGQLIYSCPVVIKNGTINKQIDLGDKLPDGIYFLRLRTGNENSVLRFSVRK